MGKAKLIIPSHKRHDRVISKKLIIDPILCVSKSQAAKYKEYNPDIEIVTHPDDIIGLGAKRNWCYEKFKDLWFIDDDITDIKKIYDEDYDMSPEQTTRNLNNVYQLAVDLGVYLFGINKNPRPNQYNAQAPISLSGMVYGGVFGMRDPANSRLRFNTDLLANDIYISLLNSYLNRKMVLDRRFAFIAKDTFRNKGGLAEFRTEKRLEEDYYTLRRMFGDSVILKTGRHSASVPKKYAMLTEIKI